jgi:hypothetical protein
MAAWTNETTATALALLKVDLGILNSTAYDQRLTAIIDATTADCQTLENIFINKTKQPF